MQKCITNVGVSVSTSWSPLRPPRDLVSFMLSIFTSAAVFSPHHGQKVRRLLTSETLDFRRFAGSICQHILFFFFSPSLFFRSSTPPCSYIPHLSKTWLRVAQLAHPAHEHGRDNFRLSRRPRSGVAPGRRDLAVGILVLHCSCPKGDHSYGQGNCQLTGRMLDPPRVGVATACEISSAAVFGSAVSPPAEGKKTRQTSD